MEFYSLDTGPWTGGNVWESGELLARMFSAPNGSWSHKLATAKVVDLGCGTGVAGLAAASQGACVTLTDRVLACAQHNRDANFAAHERWRCHLSRLSWGDLGAAKRLRLTRGPFDFVFTADTLYNSEDQEALAATVDELADGARTQVIIGSPNSGDVFFPIAQVRHGFQISDISDEPEVKAAFQAMMGSHKQTSRHPSRRRVKVYSMQR
jgi:predicted nicotinamide N-methyase